MSTRIPAASDESDMHTLFKSSRATPGYVTGLQLLLTAAYLRVVREKDAALADLIEKKIAIQNTPGKRGEAAQRKDRQDRFRRYLELWHSLPPERQLALAEHDAKISHMSRRARIIGTTEIVGAYNDIKTTTAGSIDYVIRLCRENAVSPAQMQRFLDENAVAWFSLTGHPTNPNTVDYYVAETNVARALASTSATKDDLAAALRVLRDTPIVGPHKTPIEEARETLTTLDSIYDAALAQKDLFEKALARYGYASEGVEIRQPLIRPSAWTLGDADGNPAITGEALEDGIALHRHRIAARYIEALEAVVAQLQGTSGAEKTIGELGRIAAALKNQDNSLFTSLLSAKLRELADGPVRKALSDLAYLVDCFGVGFGTIDIRYNGRDLMAAAARVAHVATIMDENAFSALTPVQQAAQLAAWLEDADIAARLSKITPVQLATGGNDATGQTAARLFGHLQTAARHPGMCEKLIIAETTKPAQALAALLLMRAAGHEVANGKAFIDLAILSESVADLEDMGRLLEDLLDNTTFRRHVVARGRLIAMIAKSDTTRLDGRGEAEYAQYEAAVDIYRVIDHMKHLYPELSNVLTSVMNGGGHSLQRGGGRVTEIPAVHGMAAAEALATDLGPSTLTIQGNQQGILFTPGRTALGTLEALASQNLYSKAGIHGEMPPLQIAHDTNKHYARADSWIFAEASGKAFDALIKDNPSIDNLLASAPWVSMKSGNASSRPASRGEKPMDVGITPREAKGNNPKALAGRAISGERLTAHAAVPVFSLLGLYEGMEAVRQQSKARLNPKKYGDPLHHLYRAYKIHRDGVRATINAAAMADFDIAWLMMPGREAPSAAERAKLAASFDSAPGAANAPEVTLSFLEDYFLKTEKLAYEMVAGGKPGKAFRHGDALRRLWPDLAQQVDHKSRMAEFSRVIEAARNQDFIRNPDRPLDETQFRITQAIYSAADLIDAPVGILATRTRLEPVMRQALFGSIAILRPQSYSESHVRSRLAIPAALKDNA